MSKKTDKWTDKQKVREALDCPLHGPTTKHGEPEAKIVPVRDGVGGPTVGEATLNGDGTVDIRLNDSEAAKRVRTIIHETPYVSISGGGTKTKLTKAQIRAVLDEHPGEVKHTAECRESPGNVKGSGGHPPGVSRRDGGAVKVDLGGYRCICDWMKRAVALYQKMPKA